MSNLTNNCSRTKELINDSIDWVQRNIAQDEARPIISSLKDLRADAKNLETYSSNRPTLAVYGASQIGKSYFMSELLKNKQENRFFLKMKTPQSKYANFFDGEYLDFLSRVNPDGGKESSGIVTRFTITQDNQKPDAQIPVKFLRQVDIAMILIDTYAKDLNNTDTLNDYEYSEIIDILRQLGSSKSQQEIDGMDENDVVDFKNYLNKHLIKGFSTIHLFNKNKIWDEIISLLPRLPYNQRYKIFELFWGKINVFNEVFNKLSEVLKSINFEKDGHVELDAILPKEMHNKKSSIIDVGTLADFYSLEKLPPINIHTSNAVTSNVGIGEVTAIVREMTLTVDDRIIGDESRKFLNNIDVYDFPGARTRNEFDVSRIQCLNSIHDSEDGSEDNILHECITRGKVNYLFNYYSDMNDITSLIFGQRDSNQNVNTLPKQIDNWLINTHGSSAKEREGKEPSLFISFHFFNIELNGKPSDIENDIEQYSGLWMNRLEVNAEKFIGKQIRPEDNWIEQWSPNQRFQNFFFLRDPNPTFNSATRIESNGMEVYNPGYESKHADMKKSFLNTPAVKRYIKNPVELWDNSASLNNTGTEYIVKSISPVTTKQRREEQIASRLQETLFNSIEKITPYFVTGDFSEEEAKIKQKTIESLKSLLIGIKTKNCFGNVLSNLSLTEDLAWKTMYDVQNPIYDHDIEVDGTINSTSSSSNDNSDLIDIDIGDLAGGLGIDLGLEEENTSKKDETSNVLSKNKTKAEIFADKLVANWLESIDEKFNETTLKEYNITKESTTWIIQSLKESLERVDFKSFLAKKVSIEIDKYIQNTDNIFLVSRLSKNYFNEFVNTFGWNHVDISSRPYLKDGTVLFDKKNKNGFVNYTVPSLKVEELKLDNHFPGQELLEQWLKSFQEATVVNLEYKYADGGVITNPEENAKLATIIDAFKNIS